MSKKVLILSGSPRKGGNSDLLCDQFLKGAAEAGHEVEKIFLGEKKIGYCKACYYCKKSGGKCTIQDDIWWGIAAWPVNDSIQSNDFSGKTVIPFCTSTSSGLGQSGELLKKLAGNGNWLEGRRFSERVSPSDVQNWIDSLDLNYK